MDMDIFELVDVAFELALDVVGQLLKLIDGKFLADAAVQER